MSVIAATRNGVLAGFKAREIFGLIRHEMELVEREFERQASSNLQIIDHLGDYVRSSGGKRVRPALLLLSNLACGGNSSDSGTVRMATVMEMLHAATLVHDDIIDNASTRRGRESMNTKFGNQMAVLMGDWLYMSAFETSLKERSLEILEILTRLTRKMTEGELIQLTVIGDTEITEEAYFDILRRKTAYLFSGCCEIGAILAGADSDKKAALRDYGMNLGVAFQLADDLLDFTSDESSLGKASGADLLEGKLTLPLIHLCREFPEFKFDLKEIINDRSYLNGSRAKVLKKLEESGTIEKIKEVAVEFAAAARKNLDVLPKTKYSLALEEIPNFVIERKS
ncbi:MAG TPA: polyprenyl synthetase family protein [Pyrinomonadaceae bacterium]|nr:polyprenyl synthetase family protein [Pyrinomonadaceae bacterium]